MTVREAPAAPARRLARRGACAVLAAIAAALAMIVLPPPALGGEETADHKTESGSSGEIVAGEESTAPGAPVPDTGPGPSLGLFRVTAATLATLAAVLVVAAVLKRTPLGGRSGRLHLEGRLALARSGALAIVSVEGRRLVLGVTPAQISLIAELEEGPEGAALARATPAAGGFDRLLAGLLRRAGTTR